MFVRYGTVMIIHPVKLMAEGWKPDVQFLADMPGSSLHMNEFVIA
jgi:hypothetical protein